MRIRNAVLLMSFCILTLNGCHIGGNPEDLPAGDAGTSSIIKLSEIAYDVKPKLGYTVYLKEDGVYAPWLVLSAKYGGHVLLLRRDLLSETRPFTQNDAHLWDPAAFGGYYSDSSIDKFLNTEFTRRFSASVREAMVEGSIVITSKESLGVTGEESETIRRNVFLLSLTEVGGSSRASVPEGRPLKYFRDDPGRRDAVFSSGEHAPWWTRTPETWQTYAVFTVGRGGIGSGSADIESGVRPAICLKKTTKIAKKTGVAGEEEVYVIE